MSRFNRSKCIITFVGFALAGSAFSQDIEPRRWSHLPLGSNFGGIAYAYTEGDIFLNPVLRIEDAEFDLNTAAFKYIHAFELLGKSARIDLAQNYHSGTWSGVVNGVPSSIDRDGLSDGTLTLRHQSLRRSAPCRSGIRGLSESVGLRDDCRNGLPHYYSQR